MMLQLYNTVDSTSSVVLLVGRTNSHKKNEAREVQVTGDW